MGYPENNSESPELPPNDSKIPEASPARPSRVGRTLVLCFDGTSNEFDDTNTNVVKLVAMLEKDNTTKQVVYYQAGIGTYVGPGLLTPVGKWIAKTADLAVGWYLDAHVKDGYKFLQSTWKPGDRICMFGFSRGAYTARALAGMLYTVGLLPPGMVEQVDFAYSIYKEGRRSHTYKKAFSRTVTIEFIGVWDTVSSIGALYPRVLPFSANNNITKTFRHALALDERRAKFRSNTWHVTSSANKNPHKKIRSTPLLLLHKFYEMVSPRRSDKGALEDRKAQDDRKILDDRYAREDRETLEDREALDKEQTEMIRSIRTGPIRT
ncbi:hypothetical protein BS47DRAFT_723712 [Hydnum rufescens UP504]|uniref:T6SS Phospholipase effector Tle1-like catalytic domain-containing protein n=1 Tax=Hydnum rufescens UP504 TaxID=1448309 RepID=A0A9P6B199_9AGAM|nr:hypothetical protein BS47DRAFT_723712 [Hydnum rufescens UP504]